MADTLNHRGPDDSGSWADPGCGLALGFRRLAIVDLSPAGHQPMVSACGRYVIVFNGEVYNFEGLRSELQPLGHRFRGHSDTEVMLAAFSEWGVHAAVRKFVGMFAFALWDRTDRLLHLVRDRLGIKPLYYGWAGKTFLFASELKALCAHPRFERVVDRQALTLYLRFNYVPQPHSIYRGIRKLPPGCILTLAVQEADRTPDIRPFPFWSARDVFERGATDPLKACEAEIEEHLEALLRQAVRLRMIADVPLGAFLSGGVDSSTVVALMQAQTHSAVKTFTIGFHEDRYNEAIYAKAVASHLGTDHTELYLSPEESRAVIPRLPFFYDEPFSDPSAIPTYLISWLARQRVTVSLSGDGGDELFGGYNRYFLGRGVWKQAARWGRPLRRVGAWAIQRLTPQAWNQLYGVIEPLVPESLRVQQPGEGLQKVSTALGAPSPEAFYRELVSTWKAPTEIVVEGREPETILDDASRWPNLSDFTHRMMFFDLATYLPDDILAKVDRASMAVSLEARVPYLDHRVVEFAARIPLSMKLRGGLGKRVLRRVLYRYVPPELIERPKMGFGVPLDRWLRGPLSEWAESLLSEDRLRREGYLRPGPIRTLWSEHLAARRDGQACLWNILMFQAWLEMWRPSG